MQYLSFCDWLISLSIMPSRFTYVVASDKFHSFFKAKQCSIIDVPYFVHSFVDEHLDYFHFLAMIHNCMVFLTNLYHFRTQMQEPSADATVIVNSSF